MRATAPIAEEMEIFIGENYARPAGGLPTWFEDSQAYREYVLGKLFEARNFGWQGGFLAGAACVASGFLTGFLLWRWLF